MTIIGDSILKGLQPHNLRQSLTNKENVYVKSFSGAKVDEMYDYAKPSMKYSPDLLILHCGTNNLKEEKSPEIIADSIIKLAVHMKNDDNEVMISGLTYRKDKLNDKVNEVNNLLKIKSSNVALTYIDNSKLNHTHLNPKGLHLNFKGSEALAQNFIHAINL